MRGCIHIYTGDGKGKTTASTGLALRFAGHDGKVLFTQFMKDGTSGEIKMLRQIPGIQVESCDRSFGFSFLMNDEEKKEAYDYYSAHLEKILKEAVEGGYGLLVMDEAVGACNVPFISEERLIDFLKNKPEELEVVLTGRDPSEKLVEIADYVSEIKKIKHPFDAGIPARDGIEQ